MGLLDRFGGDDGDDESDALGGPSGSSSAGDVGLGGGEFDDDLDLDDGAFGDDLDFGDDADGGDGDVRDLEHRVDEMESELSSLSSTMSTVRSENEEISNSVNEVEEHVRKLLDIYEMVTRGVNPFVDDVGQNGAFEGDGLGLFDTTDSGDAADIDDDVADADAESFFDEDALDDPDPADDDPLAADLFEEDEPMDETDEPMDDTETDTGDAKSFEELKAEYDSGDADWVDDDATEGFDDDPDAPAEPADGGDDLDSLFEDTDTSVDGTDEAEEDDLNGLFEGTADVSATESAAEFVEDAEPEPGETDAEPEAAGGAAPVSPNGMGEKPYLEAVPSGYVGDLVVLEWLEYLVECADAADAARALRYYETIDWIAPEAGDHLRAFLSGFGEFDADDPSPATKQLSMDHHVTSLRFIGQLGGSATDATTISRWTGATSDDPAVDAADAAREAVAAFDGGADASTTSQPTTGELSEADGF